MGNKEHFYAEVSALHSKVTGSSIPVIVRFPDNTRTRFIVDLGLFQETEDIDLNSNLRCNPADVSFVAITHNHVDHLGRLPMLATSDFSGKVYTSVDTSKLMQHALEDSFEILKNDSRLYTRHDIDVVLKNVVPCTMRKTITVAPNIKLTMFENGHLIGAAILLFQISYPGYQDINLLFTGDIHFKNMFFDVPPLPQWVLDLPITIVTESTYGTTDSTDISPTFEGNVLNALSSGKNVLCTAFSLGRFQEILYTLKTLKENGSIDPSVDLYCDGKLAKKYSDLYIEQELQIHPEMSSFYPEDCIFMDKLLRRGVLEDTNQKIIVTTSGMGTYGPASFYIPNVFSREDWLIHFTGYGMYGQRLKNTIAGEMANVSGVSKVKRALICTTSEFSSHAKADEIISFIESFSHPKFVLVNHGESSVKEAFARRLVTDVSKVKYVEILDRTHRFRINSYGWSATKSSDT